MAKLQACMKWAVVLFSGIFAVFSGCYSVPEYPVVPSISFNSVRFEETNSTDFIYLSLNFKDGDGDLGLDQSDLSDPRFADSVEVNGLKVPNPNRFNIFPVLLRKEGDEYVPSPNADFNGFFPRLREFKSRGPIEGVLQYKLASLNFFNQDSSIAKVRVFIQDRQLNKSNIVETPPFPVVYK
jgi:hypothetical protein